MILSPLFTLVVVAENLVFIHIAQQRGDSNIMGKRLGLITRHQCPGFVRKDVSRGPCVCEVVLSLVLSVLM